MIIQFLSILMLTASVGASAVADGLGVSTPETPSASITTANIYAFYGNYEFRYTPSVNLVDYSHRLANKSFTSGGVLNDFEGRWSAVFPVKPSTTYTRNSFGVDSGFIAFDENGDYLRWFATETTFTTASDVYYLGCSAPVSSTEPLFVEGSVLPNSYVAYSCTFEVNTPYHHEVFNCYFDDSLFGMTSNRWSDAQFSVGYGYMNFEFDGNTALLQSFANEFEEAIQSYATRFVNMGFEPNSEDDYEVGLPVDDIRLSAFAYFNVGNTRLSCDIQYSGCQSQNVEDSSLLQLYNPVPSFDFFDYEYPSNPYVIKLIANDGYYLGHLGTSELMSIGGNCTILGMQGLEAYPNTGNELVKTAYVFFNVPLNVDAVISFTALARPTHTTTLSLNHATGSFGEGNGNFYEGSGFVVELTASDGYGFNSQSNSVFVTGAGEYYLLYSEPIVGSLYRVVTIELVGGSTNININATALPYTQDYGEGFDNGRVDGMNNASMFEWIKTVFDGMATFFNITILPGVSLGLLAFGPLIVVAIVAIVRIIRHD